MPHTFYVALIGSAGDNPASSYMGGFKESAAFANLPCRTCYGDQDEIQIAVGS
jgi:hypothetical protein